MKNYLLILLVVLGIGVVATPDIAAVKADVATASTPVSEMAVREMNLPEMEKVSSLEMTEISETAEISTPVWMAAATASSALATSGAINYDVIRKPQITLDPGNTINYTGKAVWGHNDPGLLLSAHYMTSGMTFTVTEENGNVTQYRVSHTEIYSAAELREMVTSSANLMYFVAYEGQDRAGSKHDLVLFTCYEQVRNAEHRLVVFADKM